MLPAGMSIISVNPRIVDDFMDDELRQTLTLNGFSFTKDYSKITTQEALQTLGSILGVPAYNGEFDNSYVITIDTLMKMLAIQLRVRFGIPVVIMGDTGCGKTHLIRYDHRLSIIKVRRLIQRLNRCVILVTQLLTRCVRRRTLNLQLIYFLFTQSDSCADFYKYHFTC
jgi:hypothetical protein